MAEPTDSAPEQPAFEEDSTPTVIQPTPLDRSGSGDSAIDPTVEMAPPSQWPPQADSGPGSQPATLAPHEVPERLGRYEIVRELARGGMGVVYVGRDVELDRDVAIKQMLVGQGDVSPEEVARFRREAKAIARFQHPNIVQVFDVGQEAGSPYMVMDLIKGDSLSGKLRARGPLDEREAAGIALKLARALAYAHSCDILHRDMKPQNVLLDQRGEPKITDFGLAKVADLREEITEGRKLHPDLQGLESVEQSLTVHGQILGTPAYMPPEQAEGDTSRVDARADVYSLGATLYATLCGAPPFQGTSVLNVLNKLFTEPPIPLSQKRPGINPLLEQICMRCLRKDPADRYPSADALAADLEQFLSGPAPSDTTLDPHTEKLIVQGRAFRKLLFGCCLVPMIGLGLLIALMVVIDRAGAPGPGESDDSELSDADEGTVKTSQGAVKTGEPLNADETTETVGADAKTETVGADVKTETVGADVKTSDPKAAPAPAAQRLPLTPLFSARSIPRWPQTLAEESRFVRFGGDGFCLLAEGALPTPVWRVTAKGLEQVRFRGRVVAASTRYYFGMRKHNQTYPSVRLIGQNRQVGPPTLTRASSVSISDAIVVGVQRSGRGWYPYAREVDGRRYKRVAQGSVNPNLSRSEQGFRLAVGKTLFLIRSETWPPAEVRSVTFSGSNGRIGLKYRFRERRGRALAISPDDRFVALQKRGEISVCRPVRGGPEAASFPGTGHWGRALFSLDGKHFAWDEGDAAHVVAVEGGRRARVGPQGSWVRVLFVGSRLLVLSSEGVRAYRIGS